jgi:hypothetical protein
MKCPQQSMGVSHTEPFLSETGKKCVFWKAPAVASKAGLSKGVNFLSALNSTQYQIMS